MKQKTLHISLLFFLSWTGVFGSYNLAAQSLACHQIFSTQSYADQTLLLQLPEYTLTATKIQNQAIEEILTSTYWHDRARRFDLVQKLNQLGHTNPALKHKTDILQILFSLPFYGVKEWSDILLRDLHPYSDYVLEHAKKLTTPDKHQIIYNLGQAWAQNRNRSGIHIIHALLDPLAMYKTHLQKGESGLDFYDHYLANIKSLAFPNTEVGGYSSKKVLEIAKILQQKLIGKMKNGVQIKALNFFGSVVNGFARPGSDLDVFHHPYKEDYPPMEEQDFAQYRFQVEDTATQQVIESTVLQGTPFHWHLKSDGQIAHEHFGAMSHIFSIHITSDQIQLRFYHKKPYLNEDGIPIWNYIDLNANAQNGI